MRHYSKYSGTHWMSAIESDLVSCLAAMERDALVSSFLGCSILSPLGLEVILEKFLCLAR